MVSGFILFVALVEEWFVWLENKSKKNRVSFRIVFDRAKLLISAETPGVVELAREQITQTGI